MTTKLDMMQHLHNTYIDGHQDGEKERSVAIARKLLNKEFSTEDIAECTGLTSEEVEALR